MKKILFLDSIEDANDYIARFVRTGIHKDSDMLVCALRPNVRVHLMQSGIDAHGTSLYFTNESHERCLKKSRDIVDRIRKEIASIDPGEGLTENFLRPFMLHFRAAVQYMLWLIEIVSNAIEKHGPRTVMFYSGKRKFVNVVRVLPEEKYLSRVVTLVAMSRNVHFENLSNGRFDRMLFSLSWMRTYVISLAEWIMRRVQFTLWIGKLSAKSRSGKSNIILFTSHRYRMDKLACKIKEHFPKSIVAFLPNVILFTMPLLTMPLFLFSREARKSYIAGNGFFDTLKSDIEQNSTLFNYRGVEFSAPLIQKLDGCLKSFVIGLLRWSRTLKKFLLCVRPGAVVTNGDRHDDAILADICRESGIDSILISHGSHVYPKNEFEKIEWGEHGSVFLKAPFSFLALQTPLAEGFLDAFSLSPNYIKTGPLIWGVPVSREATSGLEEKVFGHKLKKGNVKVIMHCGTPKGSENVRFQVYERPDEYIQAICDIANAVEKLEGVVLVVKFRPSFDISIETIKALVPFSDKVLLSVDEPFIEMLGMADMLVSFSSTTIEEALQNKKPVLLYGGGGRYMHVPACRIIKEKAIAESPAYFVESPDDLGFAIRCILGKDFLSKESRSTFDKFIYPASERTSIEKLLEEKVLS